MPRSRLNRFVQGMLWSGFVASLAGVGVSHWSAPGGNPGWPEAALLLTTTGVLLNVVTSNLPLQNVIGVALAILFPGTLWELFLIHAPWRNAGGAVVDAGIPQVLNLPWFVPVLWLLAVLGSRLVAKALIPARPDDGIYGFRVLALTSIVVGLFYLLIKPALPLGPGLRPDSMALRVIDASVRVVIAALALTMALPWLIDKRSRGPGSVVEMVTESKR